MEVWNSCSLVTYPKKYVPEVNDPTSDVPRKVLLLLGL